MSQLKQQISEDVKAAMKAREQHKLTTLRGLLAAIKQIEVDTREELDNAKCIQVIQKEIKMRRDAISFAKEQSRQELVDQNETELALLQSYLGTQLTEKELKDLIQTIVNNGANNIGQIMGHLNQAHKGKFEGKIASQIIKEVLGG